MLFRSKPDPEPEKGTGDKPNVDPPADPKAEKSDKTEKTTKPTEKPAKPDETPNKDKNPN